MDTIYKIIIIKVYLNSTQQSLSSQQRLSLKNDGRLDMLERKKLFNTTVERIQYFHSVDDTGHKVSHLKSTFPFTYTQVLYN